MEGNLTDVSSQFVTFSLCEETFAVNVMEVQEVLSNSSINKVPTASEVIRGVINLRGQIIPAIDLGQRLAFSRPTREQATIVVVKDGDEAAALLVDEVGDVVSVSSADYSPIPPTLHSALSTCSRRVIRTQDSVILQIDVQKILDFDGKAYA